MPARYYARVAKMRRYAAAEIVFTLILLATILFLIMVIYAKGNVWTVVCLALVALVCFSGMVYISKRDKVFISQSELYKISLKSIDKQFINAALDAAEVVPDAYISFCKTQGFSGRILVQYCSLFNKHELSRQRQNANKVINKKYQIRSSGSIYDVKAKFRINMVVCNKYNAELVAWVSKNTNHLLSRNESIIQMAIVLDEQMLLIPDLSCTPILNDLNKYDAAIQMVCRRFSVN